MFNSNKQLQIQTSNDDKDEEQVKYELQDQEDQLNKNIQYTIENENTEEQKDDILNRLLQKSVKQYQKYIKTQEQASELQSILYNVKVVMENLEEQENYTETLLEYLEMILEKGSLYVDTCFEKLIRKYQKKKKVIYMLKKVNSRGKNNNSNNNNSNSNDNSNLLSDFNLKSESELKDEYNRMEVILQKYEGEVRTHIRTEQQLKIYVESLQEKVDEENNIKIELINKLKADNQVLQEQYKAIQLDHHSLLQENNTLVQQNQTLQKDNQQLMDQCNHLNKSKEKLDTLLKNNQLNKQDNKNISNLFIYSKTGVINQKEDMLNHDITQLHSYNANTKKRIISNNSTKEFGNNLRKSGEFNYHFNNNNNHINNNNNINSSNNNSKSVNKFQDKLQYNIIDHYIAKSKLKSSLNNFKTNQRVLLKDYPKKKEKKSRNNSKETSSFSLNSQAKLHRQQVVYNGQQLGALRHNQYQRNNNNNDFVQQNLQQRPYKDISNNKSREFIQKLMQNTRNNSITINQNSNNNNNNNNVIIHNKIYRL